MCQFYKKRLFFPTRDVLLEKNLPFFFVINSFNITLALSTILKDKEAPLPNPVVSTM